MNLHLSNLESHSPKGALCLVWLNWPSGFGEGETVKCLRKRQHQQRRQTTDTF